MNLTNVIVFSQIDIIKTLQQKSSNQLDFYVCDLHATCTSLDFHFYLLMKCLQDTQIIIA